MESSKISFFVKFAFVQPALVFCVTLPQIFFPFFSKPVGKFYAFLVKIFFPKVLVTSTSTPEFEFKFTFLLLIYPVLQTTVISLFSKRDFGKLCPSNPSSEKFAFSLSITTPSLKVYYYIFFLFESAIFQNTAQRHVGSCDREKVPTF